MQDRAAACETRVCAWHDCGGLFPREWQCWHAHDGTAGGNGHPTLTMHVQHSIPHALLPCHAVESLVAGQHTSQVSGIGSGGGSAVVASSRPAGLTIHSVMTSSGSAYQNFQGRIM